MLYVDVSFHEKPGCELTIIVYCYALIPLLSGWI